MNLFGFVVAVFFSLTKDPYGKMSPNLQLKTQVSALEEVSQALTRENQQLRSLVENLQKIVSEQNVAIERLWKQDQLNQKENEELKVKSKHCESYHRKSPLIGSGIPLLNSIPSGPSSPVKESISDFDTAQLLQDLKAAKLQIETLQRDNLRLTQQLTSK